MVPTCRQHQRGPASPDLDDELWTLAHLERYLHCGRSTVFATVARGDFPAALTIRAGRGRTRPLWVAAEVRGWVDARPRRGAARRGATATTPEADA